MNKKKFDRQQVLESAMLLFWQKGYHQCSTRDLQNMTSLKAGSLYCAFKNKQALFSEALHCYVQMMRKEYDVCCAQYDNPLYSLKAFTLRMLFDSSSPCKQCFLFKANVELRNTELQKIPMALAQEVEGWFLQAFIDSAGKKFLKTSLTPEELVKVYMLQLFGWRAYLAVSNDEKFVRKQIEAFFSGIIV